MDAPPATPAPGPSRAWRNLALLAALAVAAWWLWRRYSEEEPRAPVAERPREEPPPLPGLPAALAQKMGRAADTAIPVVPTSGTPVEFEDDEVEQVAKAALARVNAQDESLVLMQVVSATKTLDAYKTVAYDIVCNAYDQRNSIGLLLAVKALLDVNGTLYISTLRPYHDVPDPMPQLGSAADPPPPADFEDPLTLLAKMAKPAGGVTPAA